MSLSTEVGDMMVSASEAVQHVGLQHIREGLSSMAVMSGSEHGQLQQLQQGSGAFFPATTGQGTEGVNVLQVSYLIYIPVVDNT